MMNTKSHLNKHLLIIDLVCIVLMAVFYVEYLNFDFGNKMYLPLGFLVVAILSIIVVVLSLIWKRHQYFSPEVRISTYVLLLVYLVIISIDFMLIKLGFG
jgi:hypothetical protein